MGWASMLTGEVRFLKWFLAFLWLLVSTTRIRRCFKFQNPFDLCAIDYYVLESIHYKYNYNSKIRILGRKFFCKRIGLKSNYREKTLFAKSSDNQVDQKLVIWVKNGFPGHKFGLTTENSMLSDKVRVCWNLKMNPSTVISAISE